MIDVSLRFIYLKMPQSKEEKAEKNRESCRAWRATPFGRKSERIHGWQRKGIISDDWDATHEYFMSTTHCEQCSVELTCDPRNTRTTKMLDHDHSIKDRVNIRAVLCHACNTLDRCNNTSGVVCVNFHKKSGQWMYQKRVNKQKHTRYFKDKADVIRYKYHFESCQRIIAEDANG